MYPQPPVKINKYIIKINTRRINLKSRVITIIDISINTVDNDICVGRISNEYGQYEINQFKLSNKISEDGSITQMLKYLEIWLSNLQHSISLKDYAAAYEA